LAISFAFSPKIWHGIGDEVFSEFIGREEKNTSSDLIISDEGMHGGVVAPRPWIPTGGREQGPFVRLHRQEAGRPDPFSLSSHVNVLSEVASECGFSEVKVLMTMRRQDTRLASIYAQISDRVRGASQKGFERWIDHLTQHPAGYEMGE